MGFLGECMAAALAVQVDRLSHTYRSGRQPRQVLSDFTLSVEPGQIFGLLGPNGGGKTTLFKILSTSLLPTEGTASIFGADIRKNPAEVRRKIGVVFQNPSLDKKLTLLENMIAHGHLYGISGADLQACAEAMMGKLSLTDRANDFVEHLSGGLQRRGEIAKGLIHKPALLLMDEPSTGLDPGARRELWDLLFQLKKEGVTIMVTTHLMEEGDKCDRLGILNKGHLVATGTPDELKRRIGGDIVIIQSNRPAELAEKIRAQFGGAPSVIDQTVRLEMQEGHKFIPKLVEAFPGMVNAVSVGKPTLEDVFVHETGRAYGEDHE